MATHPVKLKLYDLSRGIVKTLSPIVLGKTVDGIWHTTVHVYDMEYFYGGGILCLEPCEFDKSYNMEPVKIIDMGITEVDQSLFHDYLNSIQDQFSVDKYNLVSWNCNHFTNTICNFLLGKNIPDYILNLPNEVMETSQGRLILNMMQSYQNTIAPGFNNNAQGDANKDNSTKSDGITSSLSPGTSNDAGITGKVPSVNIRNVFDSCDSEKMKKIDEMVKNLKHSSDKKKKFFSTLQKCIDSIRLQPENINQRIIYKDFSNEIFKNISPISEYDQILSLVGYHRMSIETDEQNKTKNLNIFLDAKNKTKINEEVYAFINKKVFLKKNSYTNPYLHVLHFKGVVDCIPYLEKTDHDAAKDGFIFISAGFVNNMFNQLDTSNDLKYFQTIKDKVSVFIEDEKRELATLSDIMRKNINALNH